MNLTELFHKIASIAHISMTTLIRKLRIMINHGLVTVIETKRHSSIIEKKYGLTELGKEVAESFLNMIEKARYA